MPETAGPSLIVGTAGHIDHGKSSLVLALTGTDPDRLREEKERGITIDLGFAHLTLEGGAAISFIDVPGHERFVRNMLAGAHGIDAVLLVVAADESVMPQTREHFHICRLLGIRRGILVLTKCDLADADTQAVAEIEARELVSGSFLEGAEVVRVSARTGQGLDDLGKALATLAAALPPHPSSGLIRLPVDRSFSVKGFGTVVTGTLVSGSVGLGEELVVLPEGRAARVRGIEVHGESVQSVDAGHRTALNLGGVAVEEVSRGHVLARPGTFRATSMVDVDLSLLPGHRELKDQTRVRVHLASTEVLARVRVLGAASIGAGESGLVQMRLEGLATASRGDRLIVRSYSPAVTLGGGLVLDPLPRKHRLRDAEVLGTLRSLRAADDSTAAALFIAAAGSSGLDQGELQARLGSSASGLTLGDGVVALSRSGPYLSSGAVAGLEEATRRILAEFHAKNPLRASMTREELRRRGFGRTPDGAFEAVLHRLAARKEIRDLGEGVALSSHAVTLTGDEQSAREALLEAARAAGLQGIEASKVALVPRIGGAKAAEAVAKVLQGEGLLKRVGDDLLMHREVLETLKGDVRKRWPPGSRLDVTGFKDMTGLSRKFVIPLLEYLDREKVTRRAGPERFVLG